MLSPVPVLRWPDAEPERRRLAAIGAPRLLLVAPGAAPPLTVDALEDWVRSPADPEELLARRQALRRRAATPSAPTIDADGIVRASTPDTWVALPPIEARIAEALVRRFRQVVGRGELEAAAWPDGPPADPRALDGRIKLLRVRLAALGLEVHAVARRGFLLAEAEG